MPTPSRARAGAPGRLAAGAAPALPDASGALTKSLAAGRSSGALQLSARGLKAVPAGVYDLEAGGAGDAWWEAAEVTRLDLSRNEIEQLPAELWGPACRTLTSLDLRLVFVVARRQLASVGFAGRCCSRGKTSTDTST
jgi:hypothetical protein